MRITSFCRLLSALVLLCLFASCAKHENKLRIDNNPEHNFEVNANKLDDEIYKEIEKEIFYIKNETASDIFYTLRYVRERNETIPYTIQFINAGQITLTEKNDANKKRLSPSARKKIFSTSRSGENSYLISIGKNYVIHDMLIDIIIYDANNKIFMTIRDFALNIRNNYFNDIVENIDGEKYITHTITITDDIIEAGLPRHSLEGLIKTLDYTNIFWNISDLSVFLEDKNIREIKIIRNSIDDLSPLMELHNLEVFSMGENFFVKDISPIGTLAKLKRLSLSNWYQVQDYSPISRLENLEYLFISPVPRGNFELTMLQNMVHLRELIIGKTTDEFGFSPNFERLNFDTYYVDIDFANFQHLTELKELKIYGNGNTINFEGIQNLKNLETLRLEEFRILNVGPLLELHNIKSIDLWRCINVDISPIKNSHLADKFFYQEDLGDIDYWNTR